MFIKDLSKRPQRCQTSYTKIICHITIVICHSEVVNRRRTDNTMIKRKRTKGQAIT
jgi:hypothetical protein